MSGHTGFREAEDSGSEFNAISFLVKQMISRIATSTQVEVVAVTNAGELAPGGTVDVQPLVNQVDGAGNAVPHAVIYGLPYVRSQGGGNAIIMDPQVGDKGVVVFASRDISSVKANKGQANPGSHRRHDMADGMFVGANLNGTPTQFVQFHADGITIRSPVKVTLDAPLSATTGNFIVGTGASGTFVAASGQLVTVQDGIVINLI
jgi:hypothetical protein